METDNAQEFRNALINLRQRALEPISQKVRPIRPRPQVAEIDAALERIDNGTYGVCNTCYTFMPRRDLLDQPHRLSCSRCLSRATRRAA